MTHPYHPGDVDPDDTGTPHPVTPTTRRGINPSIKEDASQRTLPRLVAWWPEGLCPEDWQPCYCSLYCIRKAR